MISLAFASQVTFRDLTMQINLKGVWWGCKYAIQAMQSNPAGGSIINTASFVALLGAATPQLACKCEKSVLSRFSMSSRYGVKGTE